MLNEFSPQTTRVGSWLSLVLILIGGSIGCERPAPQLAEIPPAEVTISRPILKTFSDYGEYTGRTEAVEEVAIQARVSGHLLKINFVEGEIVQEGDVLFEIDPRPYQATLDSKKADVLRRKASVLKAKADLTRNKELFERGAITPQQLDTSIAEESVESANLEGAKAAVREAELNLEFTKIIAPITGRVGKTNLTKGNLVSSLSIAGSPLTTIVSTDPMHVSFDVDEQSLLTAQAENRKNRGGEDKRKLSEVQWPVSIRLSNEEDFMHKGVLDFVDNQIDSGTGTIRLRGLFKNDDHLLIPGLFVKVRIPMSEPRPHLLVPSRAIGTDQGNKFVLVVNDQNKAEYRQVTLGTQNMNGMREVTKGLEANDWIVIDGLQRARPGTTVAPTKKEATSASQSKPETASQTATEKAQKSPQKKTKPDQ